MVKHIRLFDWLNPSFYRTTYVLQSLYNSWNNTINCSWPQFYTHFIHRAIFPSVQVILNQQVSISSCKTAIDVGQKQDQPKQLKQQNVMSFSLFSPIFYWREAMAIHSDCWPSFILSSLPLVERINNIVAAIFKVRYKQGIALPVHFQPIWLPFIK